MGLDMHFMGSGKERISTERFNTAILNNLGNYEELDKLWDNLDKTTDDIYYIRGNYDLHDLIKYLYTENDPSGFEKYKDNGTLIELTLPMLESIEEWYYNLPDHEFDWDKDFYNVLCSMIIRTKHGEYFYYEGDY